MLETKKIRRNVALENVGIEVAAQVADEVSDPRAGVLANSVVAAEAPEDITATAEDEVQAETDTAFVRPRKLRGKKKKKIRREILVVRRKDEKREKARAKN